MELKEELKYQSIRIVKWSGDTFESGKFWLGIFTGFLIWGLFNFLKSINFCKLV